MVTENYKTYTRKVSDFITEKHKASPLEKSAQRITLGVGLASAAISVSSIALSQLFNVDLVQYTESWAIASGLSIIPYLLVEGVTQ